MAAGLAALGTVGKVAGAVGAVKSLTGGGGSAAGQTTTTQQVDPQTQAMQQDLYRRSQQIAQQPFVPYTGPMVAGFSPDQLRQFQATRGLFESGMGYDPTKALQGMAQEQFKPTIQPVTGFEAPTIEATQAPGAAQIQATPTFGGAQIGPVAGPSAAQIGQVSTPQFQGLLSQDIGAYQSPFQQQVIDTAMQDIQRQADIARGGAQERAIRACAFGGSRSALLESESQRPYVEQMARTAAGLRQAGFEQAQRAAQADLARQQQLGIFGAGQEQQRALQRQGQLGLAGGLNTARIAQRDLNKRTLTDLINIGQGVNRTANQGLATASQNSAQKAAAYKNAKAAHSSQMMSMGAQIGSLALMAFTI